MRIILIILSFFKIANVSIAQNCNAYYYEGDTLQYEACLIAERARQHSQFDGAYHSIYDAAIEKCPYFATAYWAKSVAHLKSGDFISWKSLIDKAVELEPLEYLSNRGWCRLKFFRDYRGAIEDIELLQSKTSSNIGFSSNGDYHLHVARALCYKMIGQPTKAIEVLEAQLNQKDHFIGKYDYLHLGVLYLEIGDQQKALTFFDLQKKENNIAEFQFYIAMAHKDLGDNVKAKSHLEEASNLYRRGIKMSDPYNDFVDKVYMKDIEEALVSILEND